MDTTENRSNGQNATATANGGAPASAATGAPVGTPPAAVARRKKNAKKAYLLLGGLAAAVVAAYYVHGYMTRNLVSTDDAQIDADVVPIAARVGGVIEQMKVHDNDLVAPDPKDPQKALPVLAVIDERDFQAKRAAAAAEEKAAQAAAEAALLQGQIVRSTLSGGTTSAKAQVASSSAAVTSAAAQVAAAAAQVERARAELAKAEADLARARTLHDQGAITGRDLEAAQTARDTAKAAVDAAQAGLAAARGMQSSASA